VPTIETLAQYYVGHPVRLCTPGSLGKSRHIRFQDLPENAQDPSCIIFTEYPNIRICLSGVGLKLKIGQARRVWKRRSRSDCLGILGYSWGILGVGKRANGGNYIQGRINFNIKHVRHAYVGRVYNRIFALAFKIGVSQLRVYLLHQYRFLRKYNGFTA
jgi:hypothetical protein